MVSILLSSPASRADETPPALEDIFSLAVAALEAEEEEVAADPAIYRCFIDSLPATPVDCSCANLAAYLDQVCSDCLYPTTHPVTGTTATCPDKARWTEQRIVQAVCFFIRLTADCHTTSWPCADVASCVATYLGRPLTDRELAEIAACSGCTFDCSSTNPCGVTPPAECATTPEGLCEQLGEIIQGTRLCQLQCRSQDPSLTPANPSRSTEEEQELADAICAFARQCGYTDMCQVLPCLSRYTTVTPGLLQKLHACVTGSSPTMDMSGMCGTDCVPSQIVDESGCFNYEDPDGDGRAGTCEDLRLLILVAHHCNQPTGSGTPVCESIDYSDLFCKFRAAQYTAHLNSSSELDLDFAALWCARMVECLAEISKEFPDDTALQAALCSLPAQDCDSSYGDVIPKCLTPEIPSGTGCAGGTGCHTLGPIACDQDGDGDLDCDDITAAIKQALCACDSCTSEETILCAIDAVCSMLSNCSTMGGDFMVDADLCDDIGNCVKNALGSELGAIFQDDEVLNGLLTERCEQAMEDFRLRGQVLETCKVKDGCVECTGTPQSDNPVLLETGQKTEIVTDVSIDLPGGTFNLVRSYASARTTEEWASQNNGWLGYGWAMSNWLYLEESGDEVIIYGPQAHAQRRFKKDTSVTPNKWRARGDSNQYVLSTTTSSSGTGAVAWGSGIDVWRLVDDDGTYWEFYKDNGDNRAKGELFRSITATGWANYYTYTLLGTDSTTSAPIFRPYAVFLAIPDAPSQSSISTAKAAAKAKVFFTWHLNSSDLIRRGRLKSVEVQRGGVVTDRILYTYFHHGEGTSADLGSDGDLVQVQVSQRLDPDASIGGAAMYHRVTQYRYFSSDEDHDTLNPDDALREAITGQDHELKMVIQPEQVEYYAQRTGVGGAAASIFDAVPAAAQHLLLLGDKEATGFLENSESMLVVDLASKLIGYGGNSTTGDRWVTVQYLQSACNCAGSVHGTRQKFFYSADPTPRGSDATDEYRSAMILEQEVSGSSWRTVRETHSDMVFVHGLNYEINSATIERLGTDNEASDRARKWVTHQVYTDLSSSGPHVVAKVFMPSAMSSYAPAFDPDGTPTMSAAAYTAHAAGANARALVVGYSYTSDGYVSETRISNGDQYTTGHPEDISLFQLVSKSYYEDTNHPWLVTKVVQFRDDSVTSATSPSHDRLSTTLFRYGFATATATSPVYMVTAVERDAVAENGPRSSSSAPSEPAINSVDFRSYFDSSSDWDASYVLMNNRGQPIWTYSADKVLTYIGRDAVTGQPTRIARNTDGVSTGGAAALTSTWGANVTGISSTLSTSGWCDSTAAAVATARGGVLASTAQYNASGQLTSSTDPAGITEYVVRTMRESVEQPGLYYLAVAALPHGWTPSSTHLFEASARMSILNAGGRALQTDELVLSPSAAYAPTDGNFTFASLVGRTQSQLGLSGLLKQRKTWHRLDLTDGYGVEQFEYDSAGRIHKVTDAAGGITELSKYDVLGRVLEVKRGQSAGMSILAKIEYDNDSPSATTITQGMGNGLVTHEISYPGEGPNREIMRTYDYRGRPVIAENSLSPHSLAIYDNQDNVLESGAFSAVPSLTMSATNRLGYTKVSYGQRGLPYKVEAALDASSSSPSFLTTNSWYDAQGRLAAATRPNSPAVKVRRDALGRVIETYLTDGGSDAAPGASGNYADSVAAYGSTAFLTDDIVIEGTFNRFAGPSDYWPGRLLQTSSSRRVQDATGTGSPIGLLTTSDTNYVTTSSAFYYDQAARLSRTAEFGSFDTGAILRAGGTLPSWPPSSAPDAGATSTGPLVSARAYNERGQVFSVTDPKGRSSAFIYDHLGRPVVSINNYVPGSGFGVSWNNTNSRWVVAGLSAADINRTTSKTFDGAGRVVREIAHLIPGSGETERIQITEYAYGVTLASSPTEMSSLINDPMRLAEIRFPKDFAGTAVSSGSTSDLQYKVRFAYNQLGEVRGVQDQNQTIHAFTRDAAGRVLTDTATVASGSPIDDDIDRIGFAYSALGQLSTVTSYRVSGSTATAANQVQYLYNANQLLENLVQDPDGAVTTSGSGTSLVGTGNSRTVLHQYVSSTTANYLRPSSLTYPINVSGHSTVLNMGYGGSGSIDQRISRVADITINSDTLPLVSYTRLGLGVPVTVEIPAVDLAFDLTTAHESTLVGSTTFPAGSRRTNTSSSGYKGAYPGLDRFGRLLDQGWITSSQFTTTTGGIVPSSNQVFRERFTYDVVGNRTRRDQVRAAPIGGPNNEDFTLDGLDRLTEHLLGTRSGTADISSSAMALGSRKWDLDAVGNWKSVKTTTDANQAFTDNAVSYDLRQHSAVNELSNRSVLPLSTTPSFPSTPEFSYDAAGNMTQGTDVVLRPIQLMHDAWNRLVGVKVKNGSTWYDLAKYEYNGLHWRTLESLDGAALVDTAGTPDGTLERKTFMYYSSSWSLIHEETDLGGSSAIDQVAQNLYGLRGPDDLIARRIDAGAGDTRSTAGAPDGGYVDSVDGDYRIATDALGSPVAAIRVGKNAVWQRWKYDAYGMPITGGPGDYNEDGGIDFYDYDQFVADIEETNGPAGLLRADMSRDGATDFFDYDDFVLLFERAAATLEGETVMPNLRHSFAGYLRDPATGLMLARNRWYHPGLGRWIERDPAGYVDGRNLYQYVGGMPGNFTDPMGLCMCGPEGSNSATQSSPSGIPPRASLDRNGMPRLIPGFDVKNLPTPSVERHRVPEDWEWGGATTNPRAFPDFVTDSRGQPYWRSEGMKLSDKSFSATMEAVHNIALAVAAGFVTGGGEAMDLEMLLGPGYEPWERVSAGFSLALNACTAGFLPNFAPVRMGAHAAEEGAMAVRGERAVAKEASRWTKSEFKGTRVYQRNDLIDATRVDRQGRTNLQRMQEGLAPIGPDGRSMHLHHNLQTNDSPLSEMTATFHQNNSRVIHINPNTIGSGIDRPAFDAFRGEYWINRAKDFSP